MDIAIITTAIGLAKSLTELKASLGENVPQKVRDQIAALADKVSEIQMELLAAQQREIDLTDEKRGLEDKLRLMNDWNEEKERYELHRVGPIAIVYALGSQFQEGKPPHWLCANCFEDGKKSHLQGDAGTRAFGKRVWTCTRCNAEVLVDISVQPSPKPMSR